MIPTDAQSAAMRAALLLQRQNRLPEAITAFHALLERWPALPDAWFNLGFVLRFARQHEAALSAYQRAIECGIAQPEEAHLNRSVILSDYLHRPSEAEQELKLALDANPNFIGAWFNLGNLYEDLGRRADAEHAYLRILALDAHAYLALARLANLQPPAQDPKPTIAKLRQALRSPGLAAEAQADLGFALGRLLDISREYDAAFAAYAQANRATSAHSNPEPAYDRRAQEHLVDRLIAASASRSASAPAHAAQRPAPIFICGMFRSGSTLAEQLLMHDKSIVAGGELDFWPRLVAQELNPYPESLSQLSQAQRADIAARYIAQLQQVAPGVHYVTDKRPDNFLHLGLIKQVFPTARIIHTVRSALDNCLSIFFLHLDGRMSYARDLLDIGHYYREYRRLMLHWKTLYAADILDFDYDALVMNPQAELQKVYTFLGIDWDGTLPAARTGTAIKTASVWQVRERLYTHASGRARHYAAHLAGLRALLESPR